MKGMQMKIFIGSSKEAIGPLGWVAECLEKAGHEPLRWDKESLFPLGEYTFTRLIEISKTIDAAIFIFSEDDRTWYRDERKKQPRDNVLLEYGLFAGQSGPRKTIICREGNPKIPTDLLGITDVDISHNNRENAREKISNWLQALNAAQPDQDENKNEFTWPDVEKGVDKIVEDMKKDGFEPDLVIGIGRSGGIIGGLIAGYLKAKPFRVINWNYAEVEKNGVKIRTHKHDKAIEIEEENKNILLVEGATTTGETPNKALDFFEKKFPGKVFRFAVLVRARSSTGRIKYCAYKVSNIKILPWHVKSWPTFLAHNI
jgi:hypoxanthine phosphoribosyltransferase